MTRTGQTGTIGKADEPASSGLGALFALGADGLQILLEQVLEVVLGQIILQAWRSGSAR